MKRFKLLILLFFIFMSFVFLSACNQTNSNFTIDYEEVPYEELLKKQEEELKKEQGGIFSILPFGKKDEETQNSTTTFESIPVQINESLIDKIKGRDNKRTEVEEMIE